MNSSLSQKKFMPCFNQKPNLQPLQPQKLYKYSNYSGSKQHIPQKFNVEHQYHKYQQRRSAQDPYCKMKANITCVPIKKQFQGVISRSDSSKNFFNRRRNSNIDQLVHETNFNQVQKNIKNFANILTRTPTYYTSPRTESKQQILCETSSTMKQLENRGLVKKSINGSINKKKNSSLTRTSILVQRKINGDSLDIIKPLGKGKYGAVFLVRQKYTGFLMALKVIQKKKIIQSNLLQQFIRELKIQTYLNNPGIIKLYGYFDDVQNFYQLMQLGCDGQLYDRIQGQRTLTEESASYIAKSLLKVIDYMHQKKILHRDLKPQNIVLVFGNLKICDFGWAVHNDTSLRTTFCGTPLYFSPQLLSKYEYDEKVDLWAIGIMTFELVYGKSPFGLKRPQDISKIVTNDVQFPKNKIVSEEFRQFINLILQKDPQKRPTSKQLLQTNFIKNYYNMEVCQQLCRTQNTVNNQNIQHYKQYDKIRV